ncbi:MAG: hypothetical protein B6I31_04635 [Desulfobacteraceae bacterium 4572_19]|nr:MAG: hypothetical protein B6I31_04635 [Desulfobacteraceae bacterium 4572_19]
MKECPKGHLYSDALDDCPVCEKHAKFQMILGKHNSDNQKIHKASVPAKETNPQPQAVSSSPPAPEVSAKNVIIPQTSQQASPQISPQASNDSKQQTDDEKTIFMGASDIQPVNFIVGWFIELDANEMPVNSHPIENNKKLNIGRSNNNDIILNNKTISRCHATIEYKDLKIIIHDQNSANGIIIDNKKITSQPLINNSKIILGDLKCLVRYS